jgi:hypothetical protein
VLTPGGDEAALARGIFDTYETLEPALLAARAAGHVPREEHGQQPPAQIELYATDGDAYKFLFMAKGGGSANKSYLYQETKALLNPKRAARVHRREDAGLGTSACPPYHLALVVGGTSAEYALKVRSWRRRATSTAADDGQRPGARVSRPRAGGAGARARAANGHRRAVRRQVLLPRRAGDPPAAARRVVPGGARGVVLGGSTGAREDHGTGSSSRSSSTTRRVPARARPTTSARARW